MVLEKIFGILGIALFTGILYLFSENRKAVDFKLVGGALGVQFVLALLVLGVPALGIPGVFYFVFNWANSVILKVLTYADVGSEFLFGPLINGEMGFVLAFKVLPTIVFFSSLVALLYHLRVLPFIVAMMALTLSKVLRVSGAESLAASANIFVGQTEAPLMIKPFLPNMTRSEIFCVMVGGMATVAGGVLAAYVGLLKDSLPSIGGHLLTASILSAPAAFLCAKILIPETEKPETQDHLPRKFFASPYSNFIDACARGASDGISLAINVGGMLLAFIALMALFDGILGGLGDLIGFHEWGQGLVHESLLKEGKAQLSLSLVFSWIFYPFGIFLGIPLEDVPLASSLLAKKLILNEFVAYVDLSKYALELNERTTIILSYALCGFANFSSIGIQIGGIGALAPNRKELLSELGLKCLLGGTLAAYYTAVIAGLLI